MATLKAVVLKHQIREDKTYNVKIRVTHNRQTAYISTDHYIGTKQVTVDCKKIKDPFINDLLNIELHELRKEISKLGTNIHNYSAKTLTEYLIEVRTPGSGRGKHEIIDVLSFTEELAQTYISQNKLSSASSYRACANNIRDWTGRTSLDFKEITVKFLRGFESYLKSREDMGSRGVEANLVYLRAIFNAARNKYNDDDLDDIRIPHYPFAKYKIPKAEDPEKRSLPIQMIRKISEYSFAPRAYGSKTGVYRADLARDVYLLSFFLVGMNSVDLYNVKEIQNGRLVYNRTKTADRRSDRAEISIFIEPEAARLMEKYKDPSGERVFNFYKRYSTHKIFNAALNTGLKEVGKFIGVPGLEFYSARHSWATIARNDCDVSKDDISLSLNHTDPDKKVTDKYLKKDWSKIDRANHKVLELYRSNTLSEDITTAEE